jgi:predicted nucleic acid-binding protein
VLDWLAAITRPAPPGMTPSPAQLQAVALVGRLQNERTAGLITPTGLNEILHVVIKTGYRSELRNYQADLLARYPNVRRHGWEHLFKARPDLIRQFAAALHRLRHLMAVNNLLVLQPDDLGPIPSGRTLDDELVRTMERYELDSSDAAILIEATRAGVFTIATSDTDLRRAQLDFDVYTWL